MDSKFDITQLPGIAFYRRLYEQEMARPSEQLYQECRDAAHQIRSATKVDSILLEKIVRLVIQRDAFFAQKAHGRKPSVERQDRATKEDFFLPLHLANLVIEGPILDILSTLPVQLQKDIALSFKNASLLASGEALREGRWVFKETSMLYAYMHLALAAALNAYQRETYAEPLLDWPLLLRQDARNHGPEALKKYIDLGLYRIQTLQTTPGRPLETFNNVIDALGLAEFYWQVAKENVSDKFRDFDRDHLALLPHLARFFRRKWLPLPEELQGAADAFAEFGPQMVTLYDLGTNARWSEVCAFVRLSDADVRQEKDLPTPHQIKYLKKIVTNLGRYHRSKDRKGDASKLHPFAMYVGCQAPRLLRVLDMLDRWIHDRSDCAAHNVLYKSKLMQEGRCRQMELLR